MSDVLTHGYCAYNAIQSLEKPNTKRIIQENMYYYYLGSQGPDIFFYYNVWPWADGKDVNNFASTLHKHNTQLFLMESFAYINKISSSPDRELMFAYLYGFLSHYALDQISHPYIFYYSGVVDPKDSRTQKYKYEHKLFECSLDTILRNQYKDSVNHLKTQHEIVKQSHPIPKIFDDFFRDLFKRVYQVDIIMGCASKAAKSMYTVIKFLYDPLELKRPILILLERLLKKPLAYSTAIFPVPLNPDLDYLNSDKKQWLHPCDNQVKSSESFLELFHKATLLTAEYINAFDLYQEKKISKSELKALLQNNSYDTGQSSENRMPMKYSSSIYHSDK